MGRIISRALDMPDLATHSVFLWGPRKTGKSFWIKQSLPEMMVIDLLKTDTLAEYAARPALLRERFGMTVPPHNPGPIVIDEIQKVPALLDEVHWLIENRACTFLLTGSSARKLRRGHANLLAGRAWRREMKPLCFVEVEELDLERVMVSGLLPPHFLSLAPLEDLRAYVSDYLREEIIAEGTVSNLPAFSEFLRVAALTSSELLNYTNVAREVGVSAKVVRGYFEILEDTLLGYRLRPWTRSTRRRLIQTEKFYLFDVGVANYLTRRTPHIGTPEFGKGFEHYLFMELLAYRAYRAPELDIRYWRTSNGQEVDFVLNDRALALEVKAAARVHEAELRSLTALQEEGPVKKRVVVSLETQPRELRDQYGPILILPWHDFLTQLWSGEFVL